MSYVGDILALSPSAYWRLRNDSTLVNEVGSDSSYSGSPVLVLDDGPIDGDLGSIEISAGKEVLIAEFEDESFCRIIGAECEN